MVSRSEIFNAKILIVDDQEFNVRVLDRMLRNTGYTSITSTTNPLEVCALHRKNCYDLILLDIEMPGMNGFQVMEGLKEAESDGYLSVLVITGHPDYKIHALQLGARDFVSTPLDKSEVLARVYNLLEARLLHKEAKSHSKAMRQALDEVEASHKLILYQSAEVKRLYDQVVAEKKVTERLLLNVLPQAIAERLKGRGLKERSGGIADGFPPLHADSFPDVTVLFADIVGFTKFSAGMGPEKLVVLLNDIFTSFDGIADNRGLEKIKTIGDAYMAVAGVPHFMDGHAVQAAHMALDMMDALAAFNERNGYSLQMRIGISSGAVVAGVI